LDFTHEEHDMSDEENAIEEVVVAEEEAPAQAEPVVAPTPDAAPVRKPRL
jgi:hypothetical protein